MSKLSPTMQKAFDAIKEGGGEAHPEKGGWWRDSNGNRLSFPVNDYRRTDTVGTNTIFALRRRGLLEAIPDSGNRVHRVYRIPAAATDRS